jgi:hypothetical protein
VKLILCKVCEDVVRLVVREARTCQCGACRGQYTDENNAVISGPCIPIGLKGRSLAKAIKNQPQQGQGERFTAFVIPRLCSTITHVEEGQVA